MVCTKSKSRVILVALASLSSIPLFPKAMAGNAKIIESWNKAVVNSATQSEDFITGGAGDLIVTDGFYSMAAFPKPRHPLFSFNETDLQFGYMLPVIGKRRIFCFGNQFANTLGSLAEERSAFIITSFSRAAGSFLFLVPA